MSSYRALDPRLKTFIRLLIAAALIVLIVIMVSPGLAQADRQFLSELLKAAGESLPPLKGASERLAELPNSAPVGPFSIAASFLFSFASLWIGLRIVGPGQAIMILQLLVLSLAYQLLTFTFFQESGKPLSAILAIGIGFICGRAIKSRDNQSRSLEAKEIELSLRYKELQESRLALVKQDESERRLLAADLHDQVLNDMRSIQKKFEAFSKEPEEGTKQEIESMLKQSMSQIREIMDDLCPVLLEEFGLPAAIEDRLDKAAKQGAFRVRFSQQASDERIEALSAVEKQLIYRLIQESLNNVCKHSEAKMVKVVIEEAESDLIINVIDDGIGIDFNKLKESSRGTVYMRLRAALIGAKVTWKPGEDGKGTCVEIRLDVQSSGS